MNSLAEAAIVAFLVAVVLELVRPRLMSLLRIYEHGLVILAAQFCSAVTFLLAVPSLGAKQLIVFSGTAVLVVVYVFAIKKFDLGLSGRQAFQQRKLTLRIAELFLMQAPFVVLACDRGGGVSVTRFDVAACLLVLGYAVYVAKTRRMLESLRWLPAVWCGVAMLTVAESNLGMLTFFAPLIAARLLIQERLARGSFEVPASAEG